MKTISLNQSNKGTGRLSRRGHWKEPVGRLEVSPPPRKSPIFRRLILKSLERGPVENSLQNINSGCLKKLTHVLSRDNLEFFYAKKGSTRPT